MTLGPIQYPWTTIERYQDGVWRYSLFVDKVRGPVWEARTGASSWAAYVNGKRDGEAMMAVPLPITGAC